MLDQELTEEIRKDIIHHIQTVYDSYNGAEEEFQEALDQALTYWNERPKMFIKLMENYK